MDQADQISIVVVYYEREVELAQLLARSLKRYLERGLASSIYFIDNTIAGSQSYNGEKLFEDTLIPELGDLAGLAHYRTTSDYIGEPENKSGYFSQQALKLEVSSEVKNPFYLVLDAKNHFIKPVTRKTLFGASGKPWSHWADHKGYLRTCLRHSLALFDVSIPDDQPALPTITPYVMYTRIAREVVQFAKKRPVGSVYGLIERNNRRTEFLMYCGKIVKDYEIEDLYEMAPSQSRTLFTKWPQSEGDIDRVIREARSQGVYCLGVHSKRYEQLSEKHIRDLSEIWTAARLFPVEKSAIDFIYRQRLTFSSQSGVALDPSERIIVGRGGRLFMFKDSNSALKQHSGEYLLDDRQLFAWRALLNRRREFCRERSMSYAFMVAPDTFSVHREDIPALDNRDVNRPILQLLKDELCWENFIYPLSAMRAAKAQGEVCHPTDSHWTGFGAYVAYCDLQSSVTFPLKEIPESAVNVTVKEGVGDLGVKLDPPWSAGYSECVVNEPSAKSIWNNGIRNRGYMGLWRNRDSSLPSALLFMDSYGWKIQRFLAESFSTMFVIHTPFMEWEAIDKYRPNVVLSLMAERFLVRVPDDDTQAPAIATAVEKCPSAHYPNLSDIHQ